MLGICSACGNTEWDKEVTGNIIRCPKCGNEWKFEKLPIFFLTGCSGVGKTTTAIELQKMTDEYVIIDVDWLRNIAWPQNDEEENEDNDDFNGRKKSKINKSKVNFGYLGESANVGINKNGLKEIECVKY